jgi:CBS-domain-containing membrane protein
MNVKDVMTPHVLAVSPDELVIVAARLMLEKKISGLPVVDDSEKLVGVVTEGDFLRRAETGTKRHRPRWVEFFLGALAASRRSTFSLAAGRLVTL